MYRLFLALEIPEPIRAELIGLQKRLKRTGADVRWVRPEAIHLTLKFIGDFPVDLINPLAEALAPVAAACPALSATPAAAGCFPGLDRPRVVWAGLTGDLAAMADLARSIDRVTVGFDVPEEKRRFSPHLTLGRVKSGQGRQALIKAVTELMDYRGTEFTARELILFRSQLKPGEAEYTKLKRLGLGG